MAAKVCPTCGLKSPSRATRCDCGYQFQPASEARRTCPDCDSVWTSTTPRCSCGCWLDEEAREASVMLAGKLARGWITLGCGVVLIVIPAVGAPFGLAWMIGAGGLIAKGMHAIAYARNGLRSYAAPRHLGAAKPPEARVVRR